jgi:hypothetical protein
MSVDYKEMFHTRLIAFIDDLQLVCPNMSELPLLKNVLRMEMPFSKKDIHKIFRESVVIPFQDKIENKDEAFFLQDADYSSITKEFDLINKIKSIWSTLSPENKEAVWKHLILLIKLNAKS